MGFFIPHLSYSFTKLPGDAKVSARFPLYLSGDRRMQDTATSKIHKLEVTDDTLTSRGGLAFFVKYLEAIGIVGLLLHKFAGIKKSIKGVSVRNLFLQVLYFFFDGTSRHLSYFDELQPEEGYQAVVEKMLRGIVSLIRTRYDGSVSIIVRLDAGFFDEKNFALFDDLGIGFLATGKVYDAIKEKVQAIPKKKWKEYANERQVWSYARFSYQCESWKKAYRALYTRPQYDDQQRLLEFARPDNIILTNLVSGEPVLERMPRAVREYWEEDSSFIYHHHQRGADELPHRGLKEFGSEQLPFKRFATNQAYYYLMLISFFLFESFKEDNLKDILPIHSYATTLRRKLVDLAAKVVRTGHEVILKVTQAAMDSLKLQILWRRCQNAVPIPLPS